MNNKIRILSTTDLHGYIYPYSYVDQKSENMGVARIKTMIDELRDENTIVIDNGDTIEGSPLLFYHFLKHIDEVSPITKAMREIEYDYVNVGNHDFNYGMEVLHRHLDYLNAPCITNNVILKDGTTLGPRYVIHEVANKKLAIFGVTSHFITRWEKEENIESMQFPNALETAKEIVKEIKENEDVDYIVGVYHGGFEKNPENGKVTAQDIGENQGYHMIEEIEGLDILIAGHQHHPYCGKALNTVYTEAEYNGYYLSCIEIDLDTNEITAQLLPAEAEADASILELVQDEEDECQKWLDTTLGTSNVNLHIDDGFDARLHKHQFVTFLNNVQLEATGADISSACLFLHTPGLKKEITMRDLVSSYPFPNTLVVKKINGKILREYLEKDLDFWTIENDEIIIDPMFDYPNPQHHNFDMLDGVEYSASISKPIGHRLTSLTRNGVDIKDDDEFTLVVNNYRASGGGDFFMIRDAETVYEGTQSMVEIVAQYLMKHKVIDFEPVNNIKIEK